MSPPDADGKISSGADKPESSGGVGAEINPNPCLDYGIKNLTIETTSEAVGIWGHTAVDSFRIVTESFATYEGGKYRWFEPHYYKFGGT